jgi:hypothetical protein
MTNKKRKKNKGFVCDMKIEEQEWIMLPNKGNFGLIYSQWSVE